jgi:hypothetical protein
VILVIALVGVIMAHIGYVALFLRSWSRHSWTLEHLTALLVLWQAQTGAAFALVAALIGAAAIWQQTQAQLAAAGEKDRLRGYGIALGVYPELILIEVAHERAANMINKEWPKGSAQGPQAEIAAYVRKACIRVPSILNRSFDSLYLLGDAGHSLQQLMSFILQYDDMLETLAANIEQGIGRPDLAAHHESFQGHLTAIDISLREAQQKLRPIHDEAAPENQDTARDLVRRRGPS